MSDDLQFSQRQHVLTCFMRMGRIHISDIDTIHHLRRLKVKFVNRLFFIDHYFIALRAIGVDQLRFRAEQVTVSAVRIVDLDLIDQRCFLQIKMHRDRQLDILRQLFVLIPVGLDVIQQLEVTADVAIKQSLVCGLRSTLDQLIDIRAIIARQELIGHRDIEIIIAEIDHLNDVFIGAFDRAVIRSHHGHGRQIDDEVLVIDVADAIERDIFLRSHRDRGQYHGAVEQFLIAHIDRVVVDIGRTIIINDVACHALGVHIACIQVF